MNNKFICPVCKYNGLDYAPYNKHGIGSDEICVCCGFQFGYDDFPYEDAEQLRENWRLKWIQQGCNWFSEYTLPPKDWDPKKQLDK